MSSNKNFWAIQEPHSRVKTEIATEYFYKWANIMRQQDGDMSYLDLCSGRGYYEDGSRSTPLVVLDKISRDKELTRRVKTHFYEKVRWVYRDLEAAIKHHSVYSKLRYEPKINPMEIRQETVPSLPITEMTFTFIDPWGYKGISLSLLSRVVKDWGSDCLFYLSIDAVRRNIENPKGEMEIRSIFGDSGFEELHRSKRNASQKNPFHRSVIRQLTTAISSATKQRIFVLPFAVECEGRRGIRHYLVFVTKNATGFKWMKEYMSQHSLPSLDGEPLYYYRESGHSTEDLFNPQLQCLRERLLREFSGVTLQVSNLIDQCNELAYLATIANLKAALLKLEANQQILVLPREGKRRKAKTMADDLTIEFPR